MKQLKALVARLREAGGESLVETIAAVLVSTMAITVLLTATLTAVHLNGASASADASLQSDKEQAEAFAYSGTGPSSDGNATVKIGSDSTTYSIEVVQTDNERYQVYRAAE